MKLIWCDHQRTIAPAVILFFIMGMFFSFAEKVTAQTTVNVAPLESTSVSEQTLNTQSHRPSVTLSSENSSEYGGSVKLIWEAQDSTYVDYFYRGYGVGIIDAKTGNRVEGNLPASGFLYLKIINGKQQGSSVEMYMTPYYKDGYSFSAGQQKILTLPVAGSDIAPVIKKVEPETLTKGSILTIHGRGFTPQNNYIEIAKNGYGVKQFKMESSDGVTLKIQIPDSLDYQSEEEPGTKQVDLIPGTYQVAISNENGKTDTAKFYITKLVVENVKPASKISTDNIELKKSIPSILPKNTAVSKPDNKPGPALMIKPELSPTIPAVESEAKQSDTNMSPSIKSFWTRFISIFR